MTARSSTAPFVPHSSAAARASTKSSAAPCGPTATVRWIHGKGSASFENGKPVRLAGIAIDVTGRKTLELEREELLARERHLRASR